MPNETMVPIGAAMRPEREASVAERTVIDEVRALAENYAALPGADRPGFLAEVRRLSTGRGRHLATRYTPPGHPCFAPLMAMLDGLIAQEPDRVGTNHGSFSVDELREIGAMTRGRDRVVFPVAYRKDGSPVYRPESESGPTIESFRTVRVREVPMPVSPWDDEE